MKNLFKNSTLISTLILGAFVFFSFMLNLKASSLYCLYSNFSIEIAEDGTLNAKLVNMEPHAAAATSLSSFVTKADLIDSNNKLYCPEKIYLKVDALPRGQKLSYSFTPSQINIDPSSNSGVSLSESNVVNDEPNPGNESNGNSTSANKTISRKCVYGQYTLIFYTDGTVEGARPGYSVGTSNFKIPSHGFCPENIYVGESGGRGGSYTAAIYSSSQSGMTPSVSLTSGETYESYEASKKNEEPGIGGGTGELSTCDSIFGDKTDFQDPAYWIQWCLNLIKYLAIGALLLLTTMDFFKALVQNDKDALKKAGVTAAKRFIYCVLIFFLPIIVDFIMSLFGAYGTCGIG